MTLQIVDLFCGAGGTSTGILKACDERLRQPVHLTAVNHWPTAIDSHTLNHPRVTHLCESVENIHPLDLVRSGRLNLLAASCECRFHSRARPGGPCNEQSRSQAWQLTRWATDIEVENILMENVREFAHWGPLHLRTKLPLKSRRGEFFRSFLNTLSNLGYKVDWKVQNAADFGDPTSRERLILQARKGSPIIWPEPTHGPSRALPWRTARECIDLAMQSRSIFNRKRPLASKTIKRIAAGIEEFCGEMAQPFLIKLYGTGKTASIDRPMPTVTASGNHLALVQPFMIHLTHDGGNRVHSMDKPMPTITGANRGEIALIEPFIAKYYGQGICVSVDKPMDTLTTRDRFALVQPVQSERTGLDILLRMIQPSEMAACHSFPSNYQFTGNKGEQVKQIGNSVPVELAAAHATAILS